MIKWERDAIKERCSERLSPKGRNDGVAVSFQRHEYRTDTSSASGMEDVRSSGNGGMHTLTKILTNAIDTIHDSGDQTYTREAFSNLIPAIVREH